ncbi:MAG: fibronectin type III domain-containing protein, partial [bacterium]|nr:fibronectin type III domain-containing protein [bacterium]
YRVRAYNAVGESGYSNEANAATLLAAPTNLEAVPMSSSRIDLSWSDNSGAEDGFKIERKTGGGTYTQIDTVGVNITTYQDTGLDTQTTYYYRVRAYNAAGDSGYSNEANATTFAGTEAGKIAFVSDRDGNAEIYAMSIDGQNQSNLTNNDTAQDKAPAISPDGYRIAFASNRSSIQYEIYTMSAGGLNPTRLTNNSADDNYPVFSPNGNKIAFESARDGNYEIYIMDANGSNQTNLTNNPYWDQHPTFSPDGTRIAFTSMRDGDYEIWIMNVDGSVPAKLTDNIATDYYPSFGPDGRIVFVSTRNGNEEIYVMNSDGTAQTGLTNNPAIDRYPCFSPNGSRITFNTNRDGGGYRVYVMDADGSNPAPLTIHPSDNYDPYWGTGQAPDTTPPIAFDLLSPLNGSQVDTTSPLLGWGSSSDPESGLAGYDLYIDGAWNKSVDASITSTTPASPLSGGQHAWYVNARNKAGLTTRSTSVFTFNTDGTPPVTSITLDPNYQNYYITSSTTVTLSPVDTGSGVASTMYRINSEAWLSYTTAFTLAGRSEGEHTIQYYSTDNAGNVESTKSTAVYIDNISPTTTMAVGDPNEVMGSFTYVTLNTTFTLSAVDTGAGAASTEYRIDAGGWKSYTAAFSLQNEGIVTEGAHTIEYRSTDNLQNAEAVKSLAVYLDQTPPATGMAISTPKYTGDKTYVGPTTTFTLTATDTGVGVLSTVYRIDGGNWMSAAAFTLAGKSEGGYTIEYRSTDKLQQVEETKSLSVYFDQTAPVTNLGISQPKYVAGNKVYVKASTSFIMSVTEDGSGTDSTSYRIDSGDWKPYTAPFSLQSEGIGTEGDHILQYYSTDNLGNTEDTKSFSIYLDNTPPATTDNAPLGWSNMPVTINLSPTDMGAGTATTHYSTDGISWKTGTQVSFMVSGIYTLRYYSADRLGNQEQTHQIEVKLDMTPPNEFALLSPANGDWTNSPSPVFTWSPTINGESGMAGYDLYLDGALNKSVDAQTTSTQPEGTMTEGSHTWYVVARNNAGDTIASNSVFEINLDNTPPATTLNISGPQYGSYITSATQFSLAATDTGAGVASTRYRIDAGSWTSYPGISFSLTASGTHTIYYQSTDYSGNTEDTKSLAVYLDQTPPQTSLNISGPQYGSYVTSAAQFSLAATDTGAGMASTRYRIDDGSWTSYPGVSFSLTASGTHTIYYQSTDHLGNTEDTKSLAVYLDNTPPVTTDDVPPGWSNTPVTINFSPADTGSGVATTHYSTDGISWNTGIQVSLTASGIYTIRYYSTDHLGNQEQIHQTEVKIDLTAPVGFNLLNPANGDWIDSPSPVFRWSSTTNGESGMAGYDLYSDGALNKSIGAQTTSTQLNGTISEGTHTWYVVARNNAGDTTMASNAPFEINLDLTPPTTGISVSDTNFPVDQVTYVTSANTFNLSAVDTGSGVKSIRYRIDSGGWNTYPGPFSVETAGAHTIGYQSEDTLGHWEAEKTLNIYVDDAPPIIALSITGPQYSPDGVKYVDTTTSFSLSDTDGGGVGVGLTEYRLDGAGTWTTYTGSFTLAGETEDTHTLEYRSADKLGNQTGIGSVTLYLDNTPPATTDNAPVDWSDTELIITLTPGDIGSGVAATYFTIDGTVPNTSSAEGTEILLENEGIYTVKYFSADNLGHQEAINEKEIRIDLTLPLAFTLLTPDSGTWTNNSSPVFTWQATTNGESGIAGYDLYLNGVLNKSVGSGDTSAQLAAGTTLDEGPNTWHVIARNNAGSDRRSTAVFGINLDTTKPGAIAWVNDGWSGADVDTTGSETELSANWAIANDGEGSGIVAYFYAIGTSQGGTEVVGWTNNGTNTSVTKSGLPLLSGKTYYFSVKAQDVVGLESDPAYSDGVKLDSTPPLPFDILTPADGAWTNSPSPVFTWQAATDAESGIAGYDLYLNGALNKSVGPADTSTQAAGAMTEGNHTWYVKAKNNIGLVTKSTSIYIVRIDITLPTAELNSLQATSEPVFTVSWTGTDAGSGIASYDLEYRDTTAWPAGQWQALVSGTTATGHQFNRDDFFHEYSFRVRARDNASNLGNWSEVKSTKIEKDPTPPASFDLLTPASGTWTFNTQPQLSWHSSSDPESGIAGYSVFIDNQQKVTGIQATQATPPQALTAGSHTWYVQAENNAGGLTKSNSTYTINIDTTSPTVFLTALPANSRVTFMLSWAGTDDRSGIASYRLEYRDGSGSWGTLASDTTATSYEFTGEFSHTYSFRVKAWDLAGNIGSYSDVRLTTITIVGSAQWITAGLGGTISVDGGGEVIIPSGALNTDGYVQVDSIDTPTKMIYYDKIKPSDNPGLRIALDEGAFLKEGITVIIPYQEDKVTNEVNLRMYHYNENSKTWELVPGSVPNTGNNTVTATTTDTGEFRLVEYGTNPETLATISQVSNYPNPFLPSQGTKIVYHLKKDTNVTIRLYDLLGHLVKEFEFSAGDEGGKAGPNEVSWHGKNGDGTLVEAGVYLCYIEAGGDNVVRKIMVR